MELATQPKKTPKLAPKPEVQRSGRTSPKEVEFGAPAGLPLFLKRGVQAKLQSASSGNTLEREAETVAQQVMRRPSPATLSNANASESPDSLPWPIRARIEPVLGRDLSDVRVRKDSSAKEVAGRLGAKAFTSGAEIYLGPNHSADDLPLMAHEAAHVAQQERAGVAGIQCAPEKGGEELPAPSDQFELRAYHVTVNGQEFSLTATEYKMFLEATKREISRKARSYSDTAQNLQETQQRHVDESNTVIRHVADWFGGADLPDEEVYTTVQAHAAQIIAEVESLAGPEMNAGPEIHIRIDDVYRHLTELGEETKEAERAWYQYINGTISGAETTVHHLETVRDTAFAVDAGLAGGLAAPAIFSAVGGGVAGTTLALGGGALAGAGTKGALEFTSASGGELLSMGITPGQQSFDWDYVTQRTGSGVKSGAFEGFMGAGASFATPYVSGAITRGATQLGGEAFASSTAGRYTIQALTGTAMGTGTGTFGSAVSNLPSLARGDMSAGDYFSRMGKGAFWGGVTGTAFSFLPVQGLTREGGIPFSGDVAPMPRWMFAGPGSQLPPRWDPPSGTWENVPPGVSGWNPPPGFNQLPVEQLPKIPGYAWTRVTYQGQAQWEPMSLYGPSSDPIRLTWYDNPAVPSANYVLSVGGRTIFGSQTFAATPYGGLPANTGAGGTPLPGAPSSTRDDFPMTGQDYTDPVTGQRYTRGHIIDFRNTTPRTATIPDSNLDPANFTPEEPWIGGGRLPGGGRTFGVRMQLTQRIVRANPGGGVRLAQYNVSTSGRVTLNGEPVPDFYILVERNAAGVPTRAWRIPNTSATPPNVPAPAGVPARPVSTAADADAAFAIPLDQIPQPILEHLRIELLAASAAAEAVGEQQR